MVITVIFAKLITQGKHYHSNITLSKWQIIIVVAMVFLLDLQMKMLALASICIYTYMSTFPEFSFFIW